MDSKNKEIKNNIVSNENIFFKYWDKITTSTNLILLCSASFLLLGPFGLILSIFFYSILSVGLAKYSIETLKSNNRSYDSLFSYIKYYLTIITTKLISYMYILFSSFLFLIPGIICFLNYTFVPFIIAEKPTLKPEAILLQSKKLTKGLRLSIFTTLLVCVLLFFAFLCVSSGLCIALEYFFNVNIIISIIITITLLFILSLIIIFPFWQFKISQLYLSKTNLTKK